MNDCEISQQEKYERQLVNLKLPIKLTVTNFFEIFHLHSFTFEQKKSNYHKEVFKI